MYLSSSSAAGLRFLGSIKDGRGLKPSARDAGIHKEVGYRWLREKYLLLRRAGASTAETVAELGFTSSRLLAWEADVDRTDDRHHFRVDVGEEAAFWASYNNGQSIQASSKAAHVSRSTGYRWIERRFIQLRSAGLTVRRCKTQLRLSDQFVRLLEGRRREACRERVAAAVEANRRAVRSSASYADRRMLGRAQTPKQRRLGEVTDQYWQLMRDGLRNTDACRLLGMPTQFGAALRRSAKFRMPSLTPIPEPAGRFLDARERVQIADLLRLKVSLRQIAAELGRQPSTISRELRRHQKPGKRYLPGIAC